VHADLVSGDLVGSEYEKGKAAESEHLARNKGATGHNQAHRAELRWSDSRANQALEKGEGIEKGVEAR